MFAMKVNKVPLKPASSNVVESPQRRPFRELRTRYVLQRCTESFLDCDDYTVDETNNQTGKYYAVHFGARVMGRVVSLKLMYLRGALKSWS